MRINFVTTPWATESSVFENHKLIGKITEECAYVDISVGLFRATIRVASK